MLTQLLNAVLGRSFPTRIKQISQELGWRPVARGRLWNQFQLLFEGIQYDLWIENGGSEVTFTLMSNALFAPKLYPPVLKAVLKRRNEELEHFTWQLFDANRATWAKLCCSLHLKDWDAELTQEVVEGMLSEVNCYDSGLRAKGLM
jgi:hypothetical protein